jgi:hypothetical protein
VAGRSQSLDDLTRKVSIDKKLHTSAGSTRLIWLSRVANRAQANNPLLKTLRIL